MRVGVQGGLFARPVPIAKRPEFLADCVVDLAQAAAARSNAIPPSGNVSIHFGSAPA